MVLRIAITASSAATSGQTASNLRAACGEGAVTCTRSAPRKGIHLPHQHAACCNCRLAEGENPHPANYRGYSHAKEEIQKKSRRGHPGLQRDVCSLPTSQLQESPSRRSSEAGQRNSSSLIQIRWQRQVPQQWNPVSLRPYPNTKNRQQVSQLGPLI
jgi:hypothetical protein